MSTEIKIYVTNVSEYKNGRKLGKWFTLPVPIQKVVNELKLGEKGFGEEYAILDYEAPFKIREHDSLEQLNEYAKKINNLPNYLVNNLEEALDYEDIDSLLNNSGENFLLYKGVSTNKELGEAFIDTVYHGIANLPKEKLETYFDYRAFGRDVAIECSGFYGKGGYLEYTG